MEGNELQRFINRLSGAFLTRPEGCTACRVYNSADIACTTAAFTVLTFDSERYDQTGMHSTSVNTGRITITTPGVYSIGGSILWGANSTGQRILLVRLNGATYIAGHSLPPGTSGNRYMSIATQYQLALNDYVELIAYQDTGGNLNVLGAGNYSPEFWASRVA